jgi:hypothetical protein
MAKKPQALVPQSQTIEGEFEEAPTIRLWPAMTFEEAAGLSIENLRHRVSSMEAYLVLLGRTMGHTGIPQYEPPKMEVNND